MFLDCLGHSYHLGDDKISPERCSVQLYVANHGLSYSYIYCLRLDLCTLPILSNTAGQHKVTVNETLDTLIIVTSFHKVHIVSDFEFMITDNS